MTSADYEKQIRDYVLSHINDVLKEPRKFIRYPFIDPGSVYDGNVWDWDTYWSVYGLLPLVRKYGDEELFWRVVVHAKGNVCNFLDHQLPDGYIPMMIEVMEYPEPYLNMRHKEGKSMNMHKPFLCQQIRLISKWTEDDFWITDYIDHLYRYFECYDRDYYRENCGLYVWCNDIMIGMDNDPASFGRPEYSTANIFLNSFMVAELQAMAEILEHSDLPDRGKRAAGFRDKAEKLIEAIQSECWDSRDRFFYSVDVDIKTRAYDWFHKGLGVFWKTLPIKIRVWSGFIPMWAKFATGEQAQALAGHWKDEGTFHSPYGIATLAKDEKMFDLSATNNPSNWLGPIWLVANYIVFRGMLNYGFMDEAKELLDGTLRLLGEDLRQNGCLHEYYNPFDGSPVMNGGFINWNVLALNMAQEFEERKIADQE